jgi:hypothetical protein
LLLNAWPVLAAAFSTRPLPPAFRRGLFPGLTCLGVHGDFLQVGQDTKVDDISRYALILPFVIGFLMNVNRPGFLPPQGWEKTVIKWSKVGDLANKSITNPR